MNGEIRDEKHMEEKEQQLAARQKPGGRWNAAPRH